MIKDSYNFADGMLRIFYVSGHPDVFLPTSLYFHKIDYCIHSPVTRPILQVAEPLFPDRSEALHIIVSRQTEGIERSLTSN